jgi:hypothetical protein
MAACRRIHASPSHPVDESADNAPSAGVVKFQPAVDHINAQRQHIVCYNRRD